MQNQSRNNYQDLVEQQFIGLVLGRAKMVRKETSDVRLNSYFHSVASLARLLVTITKKSDDKNVCCCVYLEGGYFYYSTNLDDPSTNEETEFTTFQLRNEDVYGFLTSSLNHQQFLARVIEIPKIKHQIMLALNFSKSQVIASSQTIDGNQLADLFTRISGKLSGLNGSSELSVEISAIRSLILEFYNLSRNNHNAEDISVAFSRNFRWLVIAFDDFLNIGELHTTEVGKLIITSLKEKKVRRINSSRNNKPIHCEMKMLCYIAGKMEKPGELSKELYNKISKAVENGHFVVSKHCCGYCQPVFTKNEQIFAKESKMLRKLGASYCFFDNWTSPSFLVDVDFRKVQDAIHKHLKSISKTENLKINYGIENSLIEEKINFYNFNVQSSPPSPTDTIRMSLTSLAISN